ncbi:MAG: aminotransferase class III-fold pyridoxal phosphate-dependent enzyme [bacterium]
MNKKINIGGLALRNNCFSRAKGAHIWDDSEKMFVDFVSGYGTISLGHADKDVLDYVYNNCTQGSYLYGNHKAIDNLKEKLLNIWSHHDEVSFYKTGSEAVQAALRIARAKTGKEKIIRCGFHGWHDQFMGQDISWHRFEVDTDEVDYVNGVPQCVNQIIKSISFSVNKIIHLMNVEEDVAAVLIDPVQVSDLDRKSLSKLKTECSNKNILLIMDEVKTGLRISKGGAQEFFGIIPDISILGKAMANGFPLAAVMYSSSYISNCENIKLMGTFNDELSSIYASIATIDKMYEIDFWDKIKNIGDAFIKKANDDIDSSGFSSYVSVKPFRWSSMPYLEWKNKSSSAQRSKHFAAWMGEKGVLWLPNHMNFINASHDERDVDKFVKSLVDYCKTELG